MLTVVNLAIWEAVDLLTDIQFADDYEGGDVETVPPKIDAMLEEMNTETNLITGTQYKEFSSILPYNSINDKQTS